MAELIIACSKTRSKRWYKLCTNCREKFYNNIPVDARFCPHCGAHFERIWSNKELMVYEPTTK